MKVNAERRRHTYDLRVRSAEFKLGGQVYYFTPCRHRYTKRANSRPFTVHIDKLKFCFSEEAQEEDGATLDQSASGEIDDGRPKCVTGRPVRYPQYGNGTLNCVGPNGPVLVSDSNSEDDPDAGDEFSTDA